MTSDALQRAYRAPCPGCGAPVEFRSAQSSHAVCAYCNSLVVRNGDVLQRIGKVAELFDDHSPLTLQSTGTWQGQGFSLIGRLQYRYAEGTWTEWHALLADGTSAFLSEDNGAYVFSTPIAVSRELPASTVFRIGATTAINGQTFAVASNQEVTLIVAQGELPRPPQLGKPFAVVELRSRSGTAGKEGTSAGGEQDGQVLSIEYSTQPPSASLGRSVRLEDLKMNGLRTDFEKTDTGRQFNCPQCGAPLTQQFAASQSMTCGSCKALIDVSGGIGGELRHAMQDEPVEPTIPLGSTGLLQGVKWQVVGYQHRMGTEPDDPDEHFGWEEYLLYNVQRGFIFLVDTVEGWSIVRPCTGAPELSIDQQIATYQNTRYALKESYSAETNFVLGEFYWQVQRGQRTANRDYASGKQLLSSEQTRNELTWSVGTQIDSNAVIKAFGLEDRREAMARSDVTPQSSTPSTRGFRSSIWIIILFIVIIIVLTRCNQCDPATEYCSSSGRTSGGSYGGYSSGGSHK